jgi:hypothetical protein
MAILFPMFALFLLTLTVMLRLAFLRFFAVKSGVVSPGYYRLFQGGVEPDRLAAYSRHYINLHEAPMLFYVISLVIFITGMSSFPLVMLAWLYVVLRCIHSWVHLRSNHLLYRFRLFAMSTLVLATIWGLVFVKLISSYA